MDMAVSNLAGMGHQGEGFSAVPADARPLAIEARGLVKSFDGTRAVDGVDISVPEGAIYGILGPNGAGKTTTLRMLLGILTRMRACAACSGMIARMILAG